MGGAGIASNICLLRYLTTAIRFHFMGFRFWFVYRYKIFANLGVWCFLSYKLFPLSRVTPRGAFKPVARHTVNLLSLDHGMVKTFSILHYKHVTVYSFHFDPVGVNKRSTSKEWSKEVSKSVCVSRSVFVTNMTPQPFSFEAGEDTNGSCYSVRSAWQTLDRRILKNVCHFYI